MRKSIALAALLLTAAVSTLAGPVTQACKTPGPIRYMVEVEVLEVDGSHVTLDDGIFDTLPLAVAEVERITHDGVCVFADPLDPEIGRTCYPPVRHVRTRVLRVWF